MNKKTVFKLLAGSSKSVDKISKTVYSELYKVIFPNRRALLTTLSPSLKYLRECVHVPQEKYL